MRIHSDTLSAMQIINIINGLDNDSDGPDIRIQGIVKHGSRSRKQSFDFALSGNGRFGGQWGAGQYKAATWDEWGIALNALFNVDPHAVIPRVYESAEHFHWATGGRYRTLTMIDQHLRHNWLSGDSHGRSAGGSYWVQSCKCGAISRRLASGHTFSASNIHEFDGVV